MEDRGETQKRGNKEGEDEGEECSNRHAYCMSPPHPGPPPPPPPPPHPGFFSEWLCTVLGLLIPLGERIIFRDLPHRQGLLESQVLHFSAHRFFYGLKKSSESLLRWFSGAACVDVNFSLLFCYLLCIYWLVGGFKK